MQNDNLLSIGEASEFTGLSVDTLRRWEKKGRIKSVRSEGGHRYFDRNELSGISERKYERFEESEDKRPVVSVIETSPSSPSPELFDYGRANVAETPVTKSPVEINQDQENDVVDRKLDNISEIRPSITQEQQQRIDDILNYSPNQTSEVKRIEWIYVLGFVFSVFAILDIVLIFVYSSV